MNPTDLKVRFYEHVYAKPVRIAPDRPMFSITFDDVHASVLEGAVPVLEELGVLGTFYVALGLAREGDGVKPADRFLSPDQIVELDRRGHHIGCHTYSHYSLSRGTAGGLIEDAARNRSALSELLGRDAEPLDFSYPFGEISLAAKRGLRDSYASLRGIRGGVNAGRLDLAHLRAVSVYSNRFDRAVLEGLIRQTVRRPGWLILYTHDVRPSPSAWGTTVDDFRWLVESCVSTGGTVASVRDARRALVPD